MAARSAATPTGRARIPVLATYTDERGLQLPLPQAQMRESFTGLQLLAGHILGTADNVLEEYEQDFTIMQLGPSAFEIEIRAIKRRQNRLRGRAAVKNQLLAVGILDSFTEVLIGLGEVGCFLANHPDAEVRFVDGAYGPYYEVVQGGTAVLALEAQLMELLLSPEGVEILRVLVANQKQPGVAYCTLTKQVPGVQHMRRTVIPTSRPLRDFADGAQLPLDLRSLEQARARVDESRSAQWSSKPRPSNSFTVWEQL
ncbi:hypothetical protein EAE32_07460 [Kocuria tytonicola]|uniref:Uncharacterized protein n=1 Tax=Kocuria tytonicola TaxID=2055946 RepID=A0A3L9L7X9_9MICC|nr:hypothetical protein [Kocuria tytonicola]RLY94940.1 hypothetical protein EAE32_07460 [Kocuria tytonicola]